MQLSEILDADLILFPLKAESKEEVISTLIDVLYKKGKISDPQLALKAVLDREKLMSTGVGRGVALPHGKCANIEDVYVAVGVSPVGIDFEAVDEQPVHVFVLLVTPENFPSKHLKLLSKFSRMLNSAKCREEVLDATSPQEILEVLFKYDELV